jgi:hypothetical protein
MSGEGMYFVPIWNIDSLSMQAGEVYLGLVSAKNIRVPAESKPEAALKTRAHPDHRRSINEVTAKGQFYSDPSRSIQ